MLANDSMIMNEIKLGGLSNSNNKLERTATLTSAKKEYLDLTNINRIKPSQFKESDDDRIIKVMINKSPIKKDPEAFKRNLDQHTLDNPPIKMSGGTMITDQVFIGDQNVAQDSRLIK